MKKIDSFIENVFNNEKDGKIILISSGGTSVKLEKNTGKDFNYKANTLDINTGQMNPNVNGDESSGSHCHLHFRIAYIAGYDYSISEKFLFSQFL